MVHFPASTKRHKISSSLPFSLAIIFCRILNLCDPIEGSKYNPKDGISISTLTTILYGTQKVLWLPEGLPFSADRATANVIKEGITAEVGKIYEVLEEKLHQLKSDSTQTRLMQILVR